MRKGMKKSMRKQETTGFHNEKGRRKSMSKSGGESGKNRSLHLDLFHVIIMTNSVKNRYTNEEKAWEKWERYYSLRKEEKSEKKA